MIHPLLRFFYNPKDLRLFLVQSQARNTEEHVCIDYPDLLRNYNATQQNYAVMPIVLYCGSVFLSDYLSNPALSFWWRHGM